MDSVELAPNSVELPMDSVELGPLPLISSPNSVEFPMHSQWTRSSWVSWLIYFPARLSELLPQPHELRQPSGDSPAIHGEEKPTPSTPENPSKKPMWKGVIVAYIVVAVCYFPVALIGFWMFGNEVEDNILLSLKKPTWLIVTANMFVVVHVIGSYQIYAMPVFDMLETVLVKKLHFTPGLPLRLIARSLYVLFTMFVGITFPFFGGLLGFFGGFAFAPTTYFLPCVMWLCIVKPKRFGLSWTINWICIILGVLLMVLSPIGGLRQIILQSKTYHFYS